MLKRRYAPDEHLTCYLRKRKPNSDDYEEIVFPFKAEIISELKKQKFEIISGTLATRATLQIRSSNCPYDIKENDKIEVLGTERLVNFVAIDLVNLEMLNDDKFNRDVLLKIAPKIIGFGN